MAAAAPQLARSRRWCRRAQPGGALQRGCSGRWIVRLLISLDHDDDGDDGDEQDGDADAEALVLPPHCVLEPGRRLLEPHGVVLHVLRLVYQEVNVLTPLQYFLCTCPNARERVRGKRERSAESTSERASTGKRAGDEGRGCSLQCATLAWEVLFGT